MGAVGQAQKLDAFLYVGPVGGLVRLDVAQDAVLLGAPLGRLTVEEGVVDPAIQLVHVHRVDAVLKAAVLGLEPSDGLVVEGLLVVVAFAQRGDDPFQDVPGERQFPEQFREPLFEHLLARVRLRATALVPRAVVVDVLLLLQFADHRASAMAAPDEVAEGELVPRLARLLAAAPIEPVLDLLPQRARDDRLVLACVGLAVEIEIARVDAVAQDLVDGGSRHRELALGVLEAVLPRQLGELFQGVLAGRVPFEHAPDDRRQFRVRGDGPLAVRAHHVQIAERRVRGPDSLARLFEHPLLGLLGEVVDVVLGHQNLDAVHELLRRPRVLGDDDVLLDEVDFQIQFVERDPVLEVAVKAVGLLDEQDAAGLVLAEEREHLAESGAAGLLGRLDVDELLQDRQSAAGGVTAQELNLGGDGEALPLLVLRGDAGVEDASMAAGNSHSARRFSIALLCSHASSVQCLVDKLKLQKGLVRKEQLH